MAKAATAAELRGLSRSELNTKVTDYPALTKPTTKEVKEQEVYMGD